MCMSSPKIPAPPPPPQEGKEPDSMATRDAMRRNRRATAIGTGSLLTGPSGVASGTASTTRSTLLGQ